MLVEEVNAIGSQPSERCLYHLPNVHRATIEAFQLTRG
jgi:hypothetical protein